MKEIKLGYIPIRDYTSKSKLFPDWMYEDEEYHKETKFLNGEEIVLSPNKTYELTITYPLSNPFKIDIFTSKNGMTRKNVINFIVKNYRQIYREENKSSTQKESYIPGMYNRQTSDGKYGIWGHVLEDLILHTLYIDGNKLSVGVDS